METTEHTLDRDERRILLQLARGAIAREVGRDMSLPDDDAVAAHPQLTEPLGAFVSLHIGERLRGCIGTFEATRPLTRTVCEMAVAAATRDPRFSPLEPSELDQLDIEISVLSPRSPAQPQDIEVGKHGVYVTRGMNRGVLLPQVATDAGWDRETFLEHTCLKAGLPKDAWRSQDTRIEVFTAEVFAEH